MVKRNPLPLSQGHLEELKKVLTFGERSHIHITGLSHLETNHNEGKSIGNYRWVVKNVGKSAVLLLDVHNPNSKN